MEEEFDFDDKLMLKKYQGQTDSIQYLSLEEINKVSASNTQIKSGKDC